VSSLLSQKHVLVFAATGGVGRGVAATLAREGAHVWISARDPVRLAVLGHEIGAAGAEVVDATDAAAVDAWVADVARRAGRVDAAFNAIGLPPAELGYPAPAAALDLEAFLRPARVIPGSSFLTARAAAGAMTATGGGSVVLLSASLSGITVPFMSALTAACGAVEAMTRSLAAEFGRDGVRVNCVRASQMPETTTIAETNAGIARLLGLAPEDLPAPPPSVALGRDTTVADTAGTVAFLASDLARGTTAQVVDVTGHALA
jgi:NAD(P)-dependent dehydrogenase (short-subunit alcohol dehydrogenase family)